VTGQDPTSVLPKSRTPAVLVGLAIPAALLVLVGVLSLLASGGNPAAPTSSLVGTTLVAFSEPPVDGTTKVVAPWLHGRPAVLLFFGFWCATCHDEVRALGPALGDGVLGAVRVVGIDSDASLAVARSFLAANDVRFPVAHDWLPALTSQYVPADPAAIFVSQTGRVVAVHYGAVTLGELRAGLVELRMR
jgi:peroxiredoxin